MLVLTHGDTHVYTIVPKLFKDLDRLAREEFSLPDDADIEFRSSCINLCSVGIPARIGEHVWEYISSFIGCISVIAREPTGKCAKESEAMSHPSPPPAEQSVNVPMRDGYSKLPMDGNEGYDNVYPTAGSGGAQDDMDLLLDESNIEKREEIRNGKRRVASPVENSKTTDDEKDAQGTGFVLKKRRSRQLLENVPESEDEEPASRRRRIFRASQEETSPSSSDQFGMKEHYTRSKHRAPRSPTKPRRGTAEEHESTNSMRFDSQKGAASQSRSRSVKDDKTIVNTPSTTAYRGLEPEPVFTQPTRGTQQEGQERMYIIVAHRPSKQESKFAVKGSTKVSKVVSSVCKSFSLHAAQARLFLIVDTTDDDGIMENLFPCDVDDSMTRAGAEPSGESKFLLTLPDDP